MGADANLDDLTGSVSDGGVIDWNAAGQDLTNSGDKATFGALREVARIADFNRVLQRTPLDGDEPESGAPLLVHWGHLALLEKVGSGAAGEVWRAWDPTLQREVALKFLAPVAGPGAVPSGGRLLEEARSLARLRHPGVVAVYGIAEHDGRTGMWMECLHGITLADDIARRGGLPVRDATRIGLELCRALEAVSQAGLVHGDLKPANVMIEPDGRVVLTDFGLGRRPATGDPDSRRGSGTPIFMSPERLDGETSTPASDLYALGVTLRWAVAGKSPFQARTLAELREEVESGPATPLARERNDAPERLVATIERAMAPRPEARFRDFSEIASELQSVLEAIEAPRQPRHGMSRGLALAAGLAVVLGGAAWLAYRSPRPRPIATTAGSVIPANSGESVPPPPAPATDSRSYDVEATLVSRSGGAYRRLAAGDRIAPGDWLSLEFKASKPMWVYVLNEDDRGETFLLFPQPLFDLANPVASESTLVLPGPVGGQENAWRVTSRGGREHFLVVASPEPVADIEAELQRLPDARPGRPIRYAAVAPATVERLRGVGGVTPLPQDAAPRRTGAFERFQGLAGRETVTQGVWMRKITLENPLQ